MKKYAVALLLSKAIKKDDTAKIKERLKVYIIKAENIVKSEDKAALLAKDDFPGFKIKYGYAEKI